MKLKKIASLLLAGVMVASTLAGCAGASAQTPDPDDGTGDEEPVVSLSADLGTYLEANKTYGSAIQKMNYVTFQDSSALDAALGYAVEGVNPGSVKWDYWLSGSGKFSEILNFNGVHSFYVNPGEIHDEVVEQLGNGADFFYLESDTACYDEDRGEFYYIGRVTCPDGECCYEESGKGGIAVRTYVVSGDVSDRFALDKIADNVADDIEALEYDKATGGNYNYTYTVSVSKAFKLNSEVRGENAKFFAVAIERTATHR